MAGLRCGPSAPAPPPRRARRRRAQPPPRPPPSTPRRPGRDRRVGRRAVLLTATALAVACSKPAAGPDAPAAAAHVSAAASAGALIGVWSLGGTCAADDGVELRADGSAWVSGHGEGLWALDDDGRVV